MKDESWKLYLVEHKIGSFIGVARSEAAAREHWGTLAKITPADEATILDTRLKGRERIFIAVD